MPHQPTLCLLLPIVLSALTPSTTSQAPADVLRFYGENESEDVVLLDSNGTIVHTWQTEFLPNLGIDLDSDGTLLRIANVKSPTILRRQVQRLAFDGTVLWSYVAEPSRVIHHDVEPLPNGNVLLISRETKKATEAVEVGRDPASLTSGIFEPDSILEVRPTGPISGTIVWEWHIWDHLVQDFDPTKPNYGVVANHPELLDINFNAVPLWRGSEFNHFNSVDYDPIHDWILISSPMQGEIWIIDHSTTTAEAAGHSGGRAGVGGDLLYRWGHPDAYRAGTTQFPLNFQHSARFVPTGYPGAGNVTVFNNRFAPGSSAVFELVLPVDGSGRFVLEPGGQYGPTSPVWTYQAPGFFDPFQSSAQRLPNGHTLICRAHPGWLFEVTPAGQIVWQHLTTGEIFHAHHTQRRLWADRESLSAGAGGTVQFNMEAGSSRAGDLYVLLGSASGTSPGFMVHGVAVPLNLDGYLVALLENVGLGIYTSWVGALDSEGSTSANYSLPAIPAIAGIQMNHACLVFDATTKRLILASNAVPLQFEF